MSHSIRVAWLRTLSGTAGVTLVAFATAVLTARLLGPENRGMLTACALVVTLGAGATQFGIANSILFFRARGWTASHRHVLLVPMLIVGISAAVSGNLSAAELFSGRLSAHAPSLTALVATTALLTYCIALAQASPGLLAFNIMRSSAPTLVLVSIFALYVLDLDVTYDLIVLMQLIFTTVVLTFGLCWAYREFAIKDDVFRKPVPAKDMVAHSFNHHTTALLGLFLVNVDKIILMQVGDAKALAFYALAFSLSRPLGMLQDAASVALFSKYVGKDESDIKIGVERIFRTTFIPALLVAIPVAAAAHLFIPLLLGQPYQPVALPFAILCMEAVVGAASWTLAQRFNAGGRPGLILARQAVSVVPIVAMLLLLPGALSSTVLALLMLLGAILRLATTFAMFPYSLREPIPKIVPSLAEMKLLFSAILKR